MTICVFDKIIHLRREFEQRRRNIFIFMKYRKKSYEKQFSPPPILFLVSDPSPPPSIYQFYESSCTNSRPFPPRRIHPSRASCVLRQLYLPFVAPFRCQENGMIKDGEIKSRRRTYSTRSKQCIQQFLSARSFHQIPPPPHISPRFDLCPAW